MADSRRVDAVRRGDRVRGFVMTEIELMSRANQGAPKSKHLLS